jgi:hypothetical protein
VTATIRVLERDRTFTPLGIRFWDAALQVPVAEPLTVYAWLRDSPHPPTRAVRSSAGVYAFHGLPGQADAERPARGEEHPERVGPEREYVIAVDDPAGRYLPEAFTVTLPLGYRGVFMEPFGTPAAGSPPEPQGRAYLFPSVGRLAPPGIAAIHATLVDELSVGTDEERPAAWAVLTATLAGERYTGIADADGRVVVMLPFPTPERLRLGSPPVDTRAATWPVTLSAAWEPSALRYPFPAREGLNPAWADRPSLKSILYEQGPAPVRVDEDAAPVLEWTETLVHGRELVLRTTLAGGARDATVWIAAGASPP